MSTTARDPWADAWVAATQRFLDTELVIVRRRLWRRRALGLVLGCVVLLGAYVLVNRVLDPDLEGL